MILVFRKVKRDFRLLFSLFIVTERRREWMSSVSQTRTLLALNWSTWCAPEESFDFNQKQHERVGKLRANKQFSIFLILEKVEHCKRWEAATNSDFNDTRDISLQLHNDKWHRHAIFFSISSFFLMVACRRLSRLMLPSCSTLDNNLEMTSKQRKLKSQQFSIYFPTRASNCHLVLICYRERNWN